MLQVGDLPDVVTLQLRCLCDKSFLVMVLRLRVQLRVVLVRIGKILFEPRRQIGVLFMVPGNSCFITVLGVQLCMTGTVLRVGTPC